MGEFEQRDKVSGLANMLSKQDQIFLLFYVIGRFYNDPKVLDVIEERAKEVLSDNCAACIGEPLHNRHSCGKDVTVFVHRGLDICTLSPGRRGYIVDHIDFIGLEYALIANAIDDINFKLSK